MARFGGSFDRRNTVGLVWSRKGAYPSGYNIYYLAAKDAFIHGGSYGDVEGSIGPFVAKVNPKTLKPVSYRQLVNTVQTGEWDYPGAMAIENNGFIYVVYGYRIFKVNPASGNVVKTLKLPTQVYMRNNYPDTPPTYDTTLTEGAVNASYNGVNVLPDGTIVVKVAVPTGFGRSFERRRARRVSRPRLSEQAHGAGINRRATRRGRGRFRLHAERAASRSSPAISSSS